MARDGKKDPNAKPESKRKRKYNGSAKQKKNSASRNKARNEAIKAGKVKKGDGKEIDHKDGNAMNNSKSNLRVRSRKANRADNKGTGGRKKGSKTKIRRRTKKK